MGAGHNVNAIKYINNSEYLHLLNNIRGRSRTCLVSVSFSRQETCLSRAFSLIFRCFFIILRFVNYKK